MESYQRYLNPQLLNKITRLELKARHIVEGFLAGMHKSPYYGFSVEFAQHREYSPSDDIKHLDWKVYARSDRLYIKQYELETNLRTHILLDTSESMEYKAGEVSKLDLACFIAASLAFLVIRQQDAIGLVTFDKEIKRYVPPHSNPAHMRPVLTELGISEPKHKTDIGVVLHTLAERIHQRGLIILISDLFDYPEKILKGLAHFRHRRHDVIVFHVMDEHEIDFPFQRMTKFVGLEEYPEVVCDPRSIRTAYLEALQNFCTEIKHGCVKELIDYEQITTNQRLDVALSKYLATRLGTRIRR